MKPRARARARARARHRATWAAGLSLTLVACTSGRPEPAPEDVPPAEPSPDADPDPNPEPPPEHATRPEPAAPPLPERFSVRYPLLGAEEETITVVVLDSGKVELSACHGEPGEHCPSEASHQVDIPELGALWARAQEESSCPVPANSLRGVPRLELFWDGGARVEKVPGPRFGPSFRDCEPLDPLASAVAKAWHASKPAKKPE